MAQPTDQLVPPGSTDNEEIKEPLLAKINAVVEQSKGAAQSHPAKGAQSGERFVMVPPSYMSTDVPNNVFMSQPKPVDRTRAMRQWARAKHLIQAFGVEVMDMPAIPGNQDATYCANIGVAIEPYIVLANYSAPGRSGEVPVAKRWFESQGYQCIQPPFAFEGEADLKPIRDNLWVGGFGQFTDPRALSWIEQQTGIQILRVRETNPKLYHLDCDLHVITPNDIMVVPEGLDQAAMRLLGNVANLIVVPKGLGEAGVTNGVSIRDKKVYLSGLLQPEEQSYRKAIEWLNTTLDQFGIAVCLVDTDEANKSGADLSCQVFHLTFAPRSSVGARPLASGR